jgi:hypothetical protein
LTASSNLIYPYPVVNRSIALGSATFSPSDNPSQTSTASALIMLNGDNGNVLSADSILGTNIRTDLRTRANVTDVFVYDTSKDLDGGAWRRDERAQASSWYNETIDHISATCVVGTDDRCGSREFPAKAILVATTTDLYIYDAKDNTLWMDFQKGSGATEQMIGPTTNSFGSTVWALGGRIYFGNNGGVGGFYEIDFLADKGYKINATDDYYSDKNIGNRNSTVAWTTGTLLSSPLPDATINAVQAVYDPRTGQKFVAVASNTAMSVIHETDHVLYSYSDNTNDQYMSTYITSRGDLYGLNKTQSQLEVWNTVFSDSANSLNGTPSATNTATTDPPLFEKATAGTINTAPKALVVYEGASWTDDRSDVIYVAHSDGITRINRNRSSSTNGSSKFYTKDMISEELYGTTKLILPLVEASGGNGVIKDLSRAANQFTNKTTGGGDITFGASGVRGTGITLNQSGQTDYLCSETGTANGTCDDDSDFATSTTGTNYAMGAWVKRSGTGTDEDTVIAQWGNAIGDQSYKLSFSSTDFPTFVSTDGVSVTTTTTSSTAITDTNWHHIVGVFDNSNNIQYLYVDGVMMGSSAATYDPPNSTVALTIGGDLSGAANAPAGFFRGSVDEVFYYRENITPDVVRRIYEVGARALNNHTANRITGVTGADSYQRLMGNASGGTATSSNAGAVAVDSNNQYIYAGLNDATTNTGGVTVIGNESDSAIDLFDGTANTSKKDDTQTQFTANDIVSISLSGTTCPAYNSGSNICNGSATLAIAGTNDTTTKVWMESNIISLNDALTLVSGPNLTKNEITATNVFRVYNAYNNDDDTTSGGQISLPAFSIDSNGNLTYNNLYSSASGISWDINDTLKTTGTTIDVSSSALTTGKILNLQANALTSGNGIFLSTSSTAFTGALALIASTGSNAAVTGNVLEVDNTGTLGTNTAFYIKHYATGTNNLAMRVDDASGDTTPFVIDGAGNVGIGIASPTYELEVSAPSGSDPSFALDDGNVTHGLTTLATTNTILHATSLSSTLGGTQLTSISGGDAQALLVRGVIGSTDPTDSTAAIKLTGHKSNGTTGVADLLAAETLTANTSESVFQIANNDDISSFAIMGNGNVGIGNSTNGTSFVAPIAKLTVTSRPQGDTAAYATGKSALIVDTWENTTGTPDIMAASSSGVTKFRFTQAGVAYADKFADIGNATDYYLNPGATGATSTTASLFVGGSLVSDSSSFSIVSTNATPNIKLDAGTGLIILGTGDRTAGSGEEVCVSLDGSTCTGKINAGTVDPPYTIDGKNYATYLPSMTGVKEETAGTIATHEYVPGVGYRAAIDFANQPDGSDLWLFSRVTDLTQNAQQLVVLLSPETNTRAWYAYDHATHTLSIYTARPTNVSYRLTAPRYDWQKWANVRNNTDETGFVVNYAADAWQPTGEASTPDDLIANLSIDTTATGSALPYALRDTTGNAVEETAGFAKALIANLKTGAIDSINGIFGKVVISQEVVSPVAKIDSISTNVISPIDGGNNSVDVALKPTQTFGILNKDTGEKVATFDNQGNATLSGTLTAEDITVHGDASVAGAFTTDSVNTKEATVAGTLFANHIVTGFGDISDEIQSLKQAVASLSGTPSPTPTASPATTPSVTPTPTEALPAPTPTPMFGDANAASQSASGSAAPTVTTADGNLTVNTNLFVLGDTLLSQTSITGSLLVDGVLHFAQNMIETIGQTLYIQKNKLANVDILDGTVIIDTLNHIFFRGDVAVNGNTTVNGVLGASTISPLAGGNLTINLGQPVPDLTATASASPSAGFGNLVIKGANDTVVATIDASGSATFAGTVAAHDLTASGSATIQKLNIALGNQTASGSAIPSDSAGTSLLPANFTEVTILSDQVAPGSLIYLTPLSSTQNQVLYVKQKLPGTGFIVGIDRTLSTSIKFNWWIIN